MTYSLVSTSFAYDFDNGGFHGHGIQTSISRGRDNLVQETIHDILIGHESPQIQLQIMSVHLDLLQTVTRESPQPHALEESLEGDFDDARHDRDFGKLDAAENFDFFGKEFLNVGNERVADGRRVVRSGRGCPSGPSGSMLTRTTADGVSATTRIAADASFLNRAFFE